MYRYFKMRTLKVILVVDIFLSIAVDSREAISSLGVLNSDIEEQFVLNRYSFDGEGVGRSVCLFVIDESAVFAVFHQIADTYDQARGWVILSR